MTRYNLNLFDGDLLAILGLIFIPYLLFQLRAIAHSQREKITGGKSLDLNRKLSQTLTKVLLGVLFVSIIALGILGANLIHTGETEIVAILLAIIVYLLTFISIFFKD